MPRGVKKTAAIKTPTPLVENTLVVSTMGPAGGAGETRAAPKKGSSGLTTMYTLYLKHYLETSAKYGPKTAIFLQVGGFYELYDTLVVATGEWRANCMKLAELCSLSHAPNVSEDPAFECYCWGFPLAALEKYRAILLAAGYTVVTVVQQKSATGDVSGRVIEDVSSPGLFSPTSVGGGGLIRREEQILLSVYVEPWMDTTRRVPHWHMASSAFDVTTGACVSTETDVLLLDGKPQIDTLAPFWSVYPPAEVCFYWCAGAATPPPTEAQIASLFVSDTKPLVHLYPLDPKAETGAAATRLQLHFLGETFRHSSALPVEEVLGITFYAFVRRSLFHLFQFVKDHNPSYLRLLNDHAIWTPTDNVLLGNAALEQLGMLPSGGAEKESQCLLALLQKPQTAMGRRVLRERLLKPTANINMLEARQERIAALRATTAARETLEHILRGSFDLARLHRRFQLGTAGSEEMLQLLTTYEKAAALLTQVAGAPYDSAESETLKTHIDWICGRFSGERIRSAMNSAVGGVGNGGVAVGSCHPWTRGIHADLDATEDAWLAVEGEMRALRARMAAVIEDDVEAIKWELRDDAPFTFFTTGRRGAILLANAKRRLGFDITTPKKGSGGAVSIECAAIEDANRRALAIRSAWKTAVAERWRSELHTWSTTAIDNRMFHSLVEFIGNLDADCCLARLSDEYGYVRPTYLSATAKEEGVGSVGGDLNGLVVRGLRHPIIERLGLGTSYVSHNLALGSFSSRIALDTTPSAETVLREQDPSVVEVDVSRVPENTLSTKSENPENTATAKNGILLYGVNAAGKSSLGKALGLAVLMAQAGMPVAATSMTLVPYAALFTRILGNDNLWAGMSSFVVEMTEFRAILRNAGPQTLVLGDELCAGTETASATSLVAAGVKTLADRGAHFLFATHLHELAEIPEIAGRTDIGFYHLSVRPSPHTLGALLYDRILRHGTGSPMYGLEVCRGLDMDASFLSAAFDFRRRLFSEDGKARSSVYNAAVVVERCAVCGSRDRLETHHITPQAAADTRGFIGPGRHKNSADNLVCLCDGCHSDHHSGVLEISGWVATSSGRRLQFSRLG